MTSGAIQNGVPTNVRRRAPSVWFNCPTTPKSATFTSPAGDSSTFAALMSRWIFPSPCRYSRASTMFFSTKAIVGSSSASAPVRTSAREHSMSSMTIHSLEVPGERCEPT